MQEAWRWAKVCGFMIIHNPDVCISDALFACLDRCIDQDFNTACVLTCHQRRRQFDTEQVEVWMPFLCRLKSNFKIILRQIVLNA